MAKRRTNAEIEEVRRLGDETSRIANAIELRVNGPDDPDDTWVSVSGGRYWNVRAAFEKDAARMMEVEYRSDDPRLIEIVAAAVKQALRDATRGKEPA